MTHSECAKVRQCVVINLRGDGHPVPGPTPNSCSSHSTNQRPSSNCADQSEACILGHVILWQQWDGEWWTVVTVVRAEPPREDMIWWPTVQCFICSIFIRPHWPDIWLTNEIDIDNIQCSYWVKWLYQYKSSEDYGFMPLPKKRGSYLFLEIQIR